MSIIPTIDKKEAASIAKGYLRQFKDWQLISFRLNDNSARTTDQAQQEHVKAMFELQERQNIVKAISKDEALAEPTADDKKAKEA